VEGRERKDKQNEQMKSFCFSSFFFILFFLRKHTLAKSNRKKAAAFLPQQNDGTCNLQKREEEVEVEN